MVLVFSVIRQPEGCEIPEVRKVFGADGGTLGRSSDNTWHLPDPRRFVSSMHGFVRCDAGRFFLVDTSTNGIFVNDDPHPIGPGRKVRINEGDRVRIGEYEMTAEFDASALLSATLPPVTRSSDAARADESLPRKSVARDPGATLVPPGTLPPVSRPHAGGIDEFMRALGLDPAGMPMEQRAQFCRNVADWVREASRGMMDSIAERNALCARFQMEGTSIGKNDNNPLKFSPTVDEALQHMFAPRGEAWLSGAEAIRDAMKDLLRHQQAVNSAMMAAFRHMLLCLEPGQLEQRFDRGNSRPGLLQSRKTYLWENYEALHREWSADPERAFRDLFGENFAENYQDHMEISDLAPRR